MTFAVNITDRCSLSNEVCRWLLPKKSKVMLHLQSLQKKTGLYSVTEFRLDTTLYIVALIPHMKHPDSIANSENGHSCPSTSCGHPSFI